MKKKKTEYVLLRGYRCHTLWRHDERLGRITLTPSVTGSNTYVCEIGTLRAETASLAEAKKWVLRQARMNEVHPEEGVHLRLDESLQLLFDDG